MSHLKLPREGIRQEVLQLLPGAVEPGHDGADRQVEGPGDLLIAQVLVEPQDEDALLIGRKRLHRPIEPGLELGLFQSLLGIVVARGGGVLRSPREPSSRDRSRPRTLR